MKNSFFFFIAIYCIACGNSNEKEGDARFWDLNIDELVSDSIQSMPINKSTLIIDEMESFIGKKVDLNNVIDKVQFIALKFIEGRFLGNIDKIQFDDRYIFILDIYHTKSLNVFDFETGNQIAFIESGDVSPYAPYTIDDFDYDSESNVVYLYDQNQSRIMTYSPTGELIHNKRVSLGFQNFSFSNNRFIFCAVLDKNVHLGQSLSGSNILISNPSFQIIANGLSQSPDFSNNTYVARDYLHKVNNEVYIMTRFDPEVYRINTSENILESLISYKFRRNYIRDDEISKGFEYFKTVSKEGNLYFSHGEFIVTSNDWVVSAFKSFTHPFLLSFVNLRTGVKEIGTSISSPSMGLPFFSSPLASFDNLDIGVINTSIIRSIKNSSNIQKMVSDGSLSMELAQIILSDRDLEDQVLVVYRFR